MSSSARLLTHRLPALKVLLALLLVAVLPGSASASDSSREGTIVFAVERYQMQDRGKEFRDLDGSTSVEIGSWKSSIRQLQLYYIRDGYIKHLEDRIASFFGREVPLGDAANYRNHIGIVEIQHHQPATSSACVFFRQHVGDDVQTAVHMGPPTDVLEGIYCERRKTPIPAPNLEKLFRAYGLRHLGIEPAPPG